MITSISFDHTRQLGNTLVSIAREKAGIVKPGVPLICGVTDDEPLSAIQQIGAQQRAPIHRLGKDFEFRYTARSRDSLTDSGGSIDYWESLSGERKALDAVSVGMLGSHQGTNAAVAIATLRRLQTDGWEIPESAIRRGIATARCRARIEVLSREPLVVLDTAHNLASIDALLSALDESFSNQHRILIFAATRDKDVSGMLRRLLPRFETVILTRYIDNPRGVAPERLLELVADLQSEPSCQPHVAVCESPIAAWRRCQSMAGPEHLICVAGSFFLAAEMRSKIVASCAARVS